MTRRVCILMIGMLMMGMVVLACGQPLSADTAPDNASVFDIVRFDQKLNQQIPLDLKFQDHTGQTVSLRQYFGKSKKRPVVLNLVYFECPMLCTLSMNGMLRGIRMLDKTIGVDYEILTVSFDPKETSELAAAKRESYLKQYGRAAASEGWHFLTGDKRTIDQLCNAVGFHYVYEQKTGEYAHPSGLVILTPQGRVSRYLFGVEYAPRDLKLAMIESSNGKIGSPAEKLMLMCYGYDPANGRYAFLVMNIVRVAGALTVLALVSFIGVSTYRERARRRDAKQPDNSAETNEQQPKS